MPELATPGATIFYTRSGSGPAVLLVQGVGAIGNTWKPQIEGLSGRYTVVAFDNRGIGRSRIADGRLTIDDMAADALALLDALGLERVHVAGHSMGGVIAQALALRAPTRIKSLAFLCTFARGQDGAKMTLPMLVTALRMRIGTRAMRRNAFLGLIMPERYLRQVDRAELAGQLHPLFGHDLAEQPSISMQQLRAMSKYDASSRLAELAQIPTLVLSASEDRIAPPANGRALAAAIPGATYIELSDSGHGVTIHRADEVNAILADHFARAEQTAAATARRD
ncbi:MAG TPA: alpha/beta fold hydrolase [Vicinamibacterales bacterium]|nr:alpha/beta fold hydrolase [Vicinamibacterales bacterium]